MVMETIAHEWLNYKKDFIKVSTWAYYNNIIQNYIIPDFGQTDLSRLSETVVQNKIIQWKNEDQLGIQTIKNIVMILKQCLHFAAQKYKIPVKDFSLSYGSNLSGRRRKTFEATDCSQIICAAQKNLTTRNLGVIISISCGIRIGELCALQWNDISLSKQTISIRKTLQRIYLPDETPHTKIVISPPKTPTSIREIPLPCTVSEMIQTFEIEDSNYYVLSNSDKYIEPRTYRKYFNRFLQENGIEKLNFHCLRHTFATACIEHGADVKCISDILGHSTINTTMNMYVHPSMDDKRRCMEMSQFFDQSVLNP